MPQPVDSPHLYVFQNVRDNVCTVFHYQEDNLHSEAYFTRRELRVSFDTSLLVRHENVLIQIDTHEVELYLTLHRRMPTGTWRAVGGQNIFHCFLTETRIFNGPVLLDTFRSHRWVLNNRRTICFPRGRKVIPCRTGEDLEHKYFGYATGDKVKALFYSITIRRICLLYTSDAADE